MRARWLRIGLVVVFALLVSAYGYTAWFFSGRVVAFDQTSLTDATRFQREFGLPSVPEEVGLPAPEEFEIPASGVTLSGWYFENAGNAKCAVLLLHGRAQTRLEMLPYAPLFWERGCSIAMFDARHHGDSSGTYGTWGYYEHQDALTVLEWLEQKTGLLPDQIGIMGVSYGAATSIFVAASEPGYAFAAADSSYASLRRLLEEQATIQYGEIVRIGFVGPALWLAGLRADFVPQEVSPAEAIQGVSDPVFLLHSREDATTQANHSEVIFSNADPARTVLHITDWGAEHAESIRVDFATYQLLMDDFLDMFVPGFGR